MIRSQIIVVLCSLLLLAKASPAITTSEVPINILSSPTTTAIADNRVANAVSPETAINLSALLASLASEIPTATATAQLQIDTTKLLVATTSSNTQMTIPTTTSTAPFLLPTATTTLFTTNSISNAPTSKTTAIVLIVVFSALGVTALVFAVYLFARYRKHQYPFQNLASLRSITPIDDEEIESWRRRGSSSTSGTKAMSQTSMSLLTMSGKTGDLWPLPEIPKSPCYKQELTSPTTLKSPFLTYANDIPTSPSNSTHKTLAPNARMGLTTDIRAGDVAFIPPPPSVKRQSSCSRSRRLPSFSKTISGGIGSVTMTNTGAVYSGYSKSRASSLCSMAWSEGMMGAGEGRRERAMSGAQHEIRPATAKTERVDTAWYDPDDERVRRLLDRGESFGGTGSFVKSVDR